MPCGCKAGKCKTCACGKKGHTCTDACHGGEENPNCMNFEFDHTKHGLDADPRKMKMGQIKKEICNRALNVMGTKDELVMRLVQALNAEAGAADAPDPNAPLDASSDPVHVAKRVLELKDEYEDVLNVLGAGVSVDSDKNQIRKAYLKLSRMIHPDKLSSKFKQATAAFQALVSAYERVSSPELFVEDEEDMATRAGSMRVSRSNEGCKRTKLLCPKCRSVWGLSNSGVEKEAYTHMMTGILTYHCALCLLDFGCMTAIHICPFCRKEFEYDPESYHKQITCGNTGCTKPFGFHLYHVSQRRQNEIRKQLKEMQEERMKKAEVRQARAARMSKRNGGDSNALSKTEEESAFRKGLISECPRCGHFITEDENARDHLRACKNKAKIAAHKKKKQAQTNAKGKVKDAVTRQEELQNLRTWEYLGSSTSNLWLLSVSQLRTRCKMYKVSDEGKKNELIRRLAETDASADNDSHLLGMEGDSSKGSKKRKKKHTSGISADELPSNLWSMSVGQLQGVCAAHLIDTDASDKGSLIAAIEKARDPVEAKQLLLESDETVKKRKPAKPKAVKTKKATSKKRKLTTKTKKKVVKRKKKKVVYSDSESDEEYVPE